MKAGFKALDAVVIVDDFYSDPDANRVLALTRSCQEPPAGTPRLAVTAVCDEHQTEMMCELLKPYVVPQKNNEVVGVNILFRYTLADAQKKVFCHVDDCSRAGTPYLTRPQDCAGRTSI